ncbi:hypothetical protein A1O1_04675 [Capronia coronata CBS 617.96]|uniref:BTB domain-containing protein n=1 Tax=Capronia coronata CBS 617.96 TaxID=1182541 RepID=W9YZM6_9EURO|nr:uncharacterized protein A1O1_04675 [Capronia coronata CBS 617.96]EXJ87749.1 hypothetical protein A1O1_04675 [Capronia coronata CBS 617.96]
MDEITAAQPPRVPFGTDSLIIVVGDEEQEFLIHKNLLCAASDSFGDTWKSAFMKIEDRRYRLLGEEPALFQLVQDWLYSGRVPNNVSCYMTKEKSYHTDEFWWNVYRMGARLGMGRINLLAVEKLQTLFWTTWSLVPSTAFIAALFGSQLSPQLEEFVVGHVAYWLQRSRANHIWTPLLDAHDRFASNLAYAMMRSIRHGLAAHPLDPTHGVMSPWEHLQICPIIGNGGHYVVHESATDNGVEQDETEQTTRWNDGTPWPPATSSFEGSPDSSGQSARAELTSPALIESRLDAINAMLDDLRDNMAMRQETPIEGGVPENNAIDTSGDDHYQCAVNGEQADGEWKEWKGEDDGWYEEEDHSESWGGQMTPDSNESLNAGCEDREDGSSH